MKQIGGAEKVFGSVVVGSLSDGENVLDEVEKEKSRIRNLQETHNMAYARSALGKGVSWVEGTGHERAYPVFVGRAAGGWFGKWSEERKTMREGY